MIVASMFDESGNMVRPWARKGHTCYCFDKLNGYEIEAFAGGGVIHYIPVDLNTRSGIDTVVRTGADIVFGFPPCTDMAVSGTRSFAAKKAKDPQVFHKAMMLALTVETVADMLDAPWFIENPVSILSTMYRKPNFTFNPWEYGGYLPEDDIHPRWPEYIAPRDAYPKKTCIWSGNGFTMPPKKPVEIEPGYSKQFMKLGGKSEKTKQIRSETPRGFAEAMFQHMRHAPWNY